MNHNYQFLKQVKLLVKSYEKQRELSGENFNIFSIMNMESKEVYTHSAIIAELLNPKGSHSLGPEPLKLFINQIAEKVDIQSFDLNTAQCDKEFYIGKINEEGNEGGRIDVLVIDCNKNGFVIENKIYAGEQEKQLERYQFDYPEAKVIFLTRDGHESKSEGKIEYTSISYETDITKWIEECSKLAYDKPILRETLKQYLYLIKKLTNQTTNIEMSKEIVDIINENFEASLEIYKNFQKTVEVKQNELLVSILKKLKSDVMGWDIKEAIHKGTKCLILRRNGKQIRYRIKTQKHSAFALEGLNQLDKNLIKEGFSEIRKDINTYWVVIDNDVSASNLINSQLKEGEILKKIKKIVNILEQPSK